MVTTECLRKGSKYLFAKFGTYFFFNKNDHSDLWPLPPFRWQPPPPPPPPWDMVGSGHGGQSIWPSPYITCLPGCMSRGHLNDTQEGISVSILFSRRSEKQPSFNVASRIIVRYKNSWYSPLTYSHSTYMSFFRFVGLFKIQKSRGPLWSTVVIVFVKGEHIFF